MILLPRPKPKSRGERPRLPEKLPEHERVHALDVQEEGEGQKRFEDHNINLLFIKFSIIRKRPGAVLEKEWWV